MNKGKEAPATVGARQYRAFLSYSHADERAAGKLHHWLETYRMPRRLVGIQAGRAAVPRRLTPIFRDRAELPAASSLDEQVRLALSQSDALLVLCSPAAKASRWVNAEIALFRELHPDRPIIAALVAGEPADSFPAALIARDAAGIEREPIAADFRADSDGPKLARLKIVAGLTGVPLDQIIQRDAQRQLRRVIAVTFVALFLVLLMAAMLVFVARARSEAESQRQQAEGLIEFMLTDLREKLEGVGRLDVLQTVNKRALAYYADQPNLETLPSDSLERRARILQAMGEDDFKRGDTPEAIAQFREAYRVTATLLAAAPNDPQRLFAHAQSEFWLGYVDFIRDRNDAALTRFQSYQALAERLVQLRPANGAYWRELGYAQGNICTIALARKNPDSTLQSCKGALDTMKRVQRLAPGDPAIAADLANRHAWMADALRLQGDDRAALAQREKQDTILRSLLRRDPKNAGYLQDWMLARYSMSNLLYDLGETDRARALRAEARADVADLVARDPANKDWRVWQGKLAKPLTKGSK